MGRYSELIEVLTQHGILVFGHDQGKTTVYTLFVTTLLFGIHAQGVK